MTCQAITTGAIGYVSLTHARKLAHASRAFPIAITALVLGSASPITWADDDEIPFSEAKIFFELNDTDGDLGIHALIDGEPWKRLEIEDPRERKILNVFVRGRLRRQGLTELFFESAEPPFDELLPEEFFDRFPEGEYEIEGKTLEGEELESEVHLSHVMPAPAGNISVSRIAAANDCDAYVPMIFEPVIVIDWLPVTMSHPDPEGGGAGVQPPVPITIINYEVVVEIEDTPLKISVILPPDQTSITVPDEFLALGEDFKFEILARAENYNQTAVESCFRL